MPFSMRYRPPAYSTILYDFYYEIVHITQNKGFESEGLMQT